MTLDESWFYYLADHELIQLPPEGKFRVGHVSRGGQKVMPTIMWCPTGFAIVIAIERGCKYNTGYYVSEVLTPLSEWWREGGGGISEI
jgi:hypothetical protein